MIKLKTSNWEINNINTVLFDKDGTIQDLHVYWGEIVRMRSKALIGALKLKPVFFKKICLWMGYNLSDKRLLQEGPVGVLSRDEIIDKLVINFKKVKIDVSREELSEIFDDIHKKFLKKMDSYVKILPGIRTFLVNLKKRSVKIAIVTSDTIDNAKKCMKLMKLDKYVDLYIGRDNSPLPKTTGEHARMALSLLDSKGENTICFGDAPMDLIMAKNSNCKAGVGITLGQTPRNELSKYTDYVISSYGDLIVC